MGKLPSITISDEGEELIRAYAAEKRISVNSAVRLLLESSSELERFASKQKKSVNLGVQKWGGYRGVGSKV
jgi:hypothetical protein